MKPKVWIIPHSHYDAEVFLVEKETLEIGYSVLIGALRMMRSEPTFKFALDQTCLIEPFLRTYPEEREFFQQMIDEGRLEITGGMYIMPDVNIPSGESFIRQVFFARQYLEKELNVDVRCAWTIDTFGRHPQMPQLMVKCGFDYDTFQRLMVKDGPSEFYWQGIDGTRLFCIWMPASYASFFGAPSNLHEFKKFAEQRIQRIQGHAVTPHLMAPAGADLLPVAPHLPEMVEAFNRSQDACELVLATPAEYFKALKEFDFSGSSRSDFPTVAYDLNPAFQGCYSARIDIKQWNRRLENLLVNTEKFEAVAQQLGKVVQAGGLWEAWKGVLFNQFHDIICGSHIDAVFNNTMDRFKASLVRAEENLHASLQAITDQIDTTGEGVPVVVFNPLNWPRADVVECALAYSQPDTFELAVQDSAGSPVPSDLLEVERYENGSIKRARILFIARNVPAFGYETFRVVPASGEESSPTDLATSHPLGGLLRFELDHGWLENEFYRVEFDLWTGVITRLFDKINQWEVLSAELPIGNTVVQERDFGNFWQYNGPCKGDEFYPVEGLYPLPAIHANAVDFAHTYLGDGNIRHGKAMIEFRISHPYGTGTFATRVRLYAGLPRMDIQTTLVNQDERVRYRAAFPTSIAQGTITQEIPFGAIERPEGEFPAQNWIDYSAEGHGVTLLNQGLPGNNVVDGVMMLSLLKCTALEGGYGDMKLGPLTQEGYEKGKTHIFDYALVTHGGDWRAAQAFRRGMEFNNPLISWKPRKQPGRLAPKMSFLKLVGENVVLSAVKPCPGGMIVRIYEATGDRTEPVILEPGWPVKNAFEVNLIEKDGNPLPFDPQTNRLLLNFGPFEIKTIKLEF